MVVYWKIYLYINISLVLIVNLNISKAAEVKMQYLMKPKLFLIEFCALTYDLLQWYLLLHSAIPENSSTF